MHYMRTPSMGMTLPCTLPCPSLTVLPAAIALLVLGSVTFLPGFYHTRIAYMAWRGVAGYSFKDIPDW